MITGPRRQFDARCRQRGYTLDEVRPCIVSEDGDTITVDETHRAYPRPRRGLGDMVADTLKSVGITEERVTRLLGRPCGCEGRRQFLNRVGEKLGVTGKSA